MDEQRIFDLKYLCLKKWRVDNPDGYFGQSQWGSTKEAACAFCRLAGFGGLEDADVFFQQQNNIDREAMLDKAEEISQQRKEEDLSRSPEERSEEQEWVRQQLYEGKQGVDVTLDKPGPGFGMITALVVIAAGVLIVVGMVRK